MNKKSAISNQTIFRENVSKIDKMLSAADKFANSSINPQTIENTSIITKKNLPNQSKIPQEKPSLTNLSILNQTESKIMTSNNKIQINEANNLSSEKIPKDYTTKITKNIVNKDNDISKINETLNDLDSLTKKDQTQKLWSTSQGQFKKGTQEFRAFRSFKADRENLLVWNVPNPKGVIKFLEKLLPQHPEDDNNNNNDDQVDNDNFKFEDTDFQNIEISGYENLIFMDIHSITEAKVGVFIYENNLENNLFLQKSVIQGIDNLAFLNAVILVISKPELLKRIYDQNFQIYNEHGIYVFNFYKNNNEFHNVIIDDKIPCISTSDEIIPCVARCSNQYEFWITLIEKAYAKLNFGYNNLCSSEYSIYDYVYELTSLLPEIINIQDIDENKLFDIIKILIKNQIPIGCFLKESDILETKRVLKYHIYIVHEIFQVGSSRNIILLDPWAKTEPIVNPKDPNNPGLYELSFKDFIQYFGEIIIIKDFPFDWKGVKFDCILSKSLGGPSPANSSWVDNPQYIFEAKIDTKILIRLNRYIPPNIGEYNDQVVYGFALFKLLSNETKIKTANLDRMISLVKSEGKKKVNAMNSNSDEMIVYFTNKNHILEYVDLSQGKYSLIPFTLNKGEEFFMYCELFFRCKEDKILFKNISSIETILIIAEGKFDAIKPRILKDIVNTTDFENTTLTDLANCIDILLPGNISRYFTKEILKISTKLNTNSQIKSQQKDASLNTTLNTGRGDRPKKLYDPKIDGHIEYMQHFILLGVDISKVEDNQYQSNLEKEANVDYDLVEKMSDIIDLNDYGLTDSGFIPILEHALETPTIKSIMLRGNKLTDQGFLSLIDQLTHHHHYEVEEIDLSNNDLTQKTAETLLSILKDFPKIKAINLDDNQQIPAAYKNRLMNTLKKMN